MKSWEETLQRFRALGGVLENVTLGEGAFGRGLFPQDANLPIKMSIPNTLLCPVDWLQIDEQGQLMLSGDCDWDDETKSFFLDYQLDYGIGGSLQQALMQRQNEFFELPETLKTMLISFGMNKSIFQKPTLQACLDRYKQSRRIIVKDKMMLMPIIELVNHDENSKKSFIKEPNIGISGKFKNEILINYGLAGDASLVFENYGFSAPKPYTFSGTLAINVGASMINIARFVTLHKTVEKTNIPRVKIEGNVIHLSCLVLGSVNDKSSPKKIFTKLMHTVGMSANIASNVFDGIVEQNKSFFLHLLEELKPLDGAVVEGLRTMAKHQLIPLGVHIK